MAAHINRLTHLESYAAALVLAVGMGFSRFSFTGMYPIMIRDHLLTLSSGSLAASLNYLGYLVGALSLSRVGVQHALRLCAVALAGAVICLSALWWDGGVAYILVMRGLAGVCSAFAMIGASQWLLQGVGYQAGAPLLYSGVGAGIVLSAEVMAAGSAWALGAAALWGWLAAGSAVLGGVACALMLARPQPEDRASQTTTVRTATSERPLRLVVVTAVYGLAGLGYIVTATYLPLLIHTALPKADMLQIWAAFGLGAVPSCFLWAALDRRWGTRPALLINLAVQGFGVALPVISGTLVAYLASALLVGGCFLGTPTIAMPAARRAASHVKVNVMAVMTLTYSVGQVAGPLIADGLRRFGVSFDVPLLIAAGALAVGTLGCLF